VCLRSDRSFAAAPTDECGGSNRVFALDLDDVDLTQPLLAGSSQAERQLNDMLGREVLEQGRYYESTGMILASKSRRAIDAARLDPTERPPDDCRSCPVKPAARGSPGT
jgi:hypothetical protein